MREFTSYGPPEADLHFCVERRELVDTCVRYLVDDGEGGAYVKDVGADIRRAVAV